MATINLEAGFAFITGAGSGIGKETGFTLAEAGVAGIIFADIDEGKARLAAQESGKYATHGGFRALGVKVDVSDEESVKSAVAYAVKEFGRIDYCVHSAGVDIETYFIPFSESSPQDFDRVNAVNSKGTFLVTQAALKQMATQEPRTITTTRNRGRDLGRGSIVNVASLMSYGAVPQRVAYIASKHAALGIMKSAALEAGPLGVKVNCVCPSWTRTAMFEEELKKSPPTPEIIKAIIPQGRAAEPEEVAESIAFLCSPAASYINGVGLIIDSGMSLTAHIG